MDDLYASTRIWRVTKPKLRMIAAILNMSVVAVIDKLATEKLAELRNKDKSEANRESKPAEG